MSAAECPSSLGYSAVGMESLLRVGKKAAGRELDGRTHDEYPGGGA